MIKKYLYYIVLMTLVASSCVPKNKVELTMSEELALKIFIDMNIAEQALQKVELVKKDSISEVYKSQLEKIHQVPYSEIEYNMAILQKDQILFKKFNEAFRDTLESLNRKSKPDKKRNSEIKKSSIKNPLIKKKD